MSPIDNTIRRTASGSLIIPLTDSGAPMVASPETFNTPRPSSAPPLSDRSTPDPNDANLLHPPLGEQDIINPEDYANIIFKVHTSPSDYLRRFNKTLTAHLHPDVFPSTETFTRTYMIPMAPRGDQRTYRVPLFTPPLGSLRRVPLPNPQQALELRQLLAIHRLVIPMSFYCEAGSPIHLLYHSYLQLGRLKALGVENAIRQQIEANLLNALFVEGALELLQKLEGQFLHHYSSNLISPHYESRFCTHCFHLGHKYFDCTTYRCDLCKKWAPAHPPDQCPSILKTAVRRSPRNHPSSSINTSSSSSDGPNPQFPRRTNRRRRNRGKKPTPFPSPRPKDKGKGKMRQVLMEDIDALSDAANDYPEPMDGEGNLTGEPGYLEY